MEVLFIIMIIGHPPSATETVTPFFLSAATFSKKLLSTSAHVSWGVITYLYIKESLDSNALIGRQNNCVNFIGSHKSFRAFLGCRAASEEYSEEYTRVSAQNVYCQVINPCRRWKLYIIFRIGCPRPLLFRWIHISWKSNGELANSFIICSQHIAHSIFSILLEPNLCMGAPTWLGRGQQTRS
jgi:hypothetical protein